MLSLRQRVASTHEARTTTMQPSKITLIMSSIMQDKEREWATAFRNWSMENKDNKWYDSRFPNMGTEEHPLVGHNFDDWSFQVRNAIREALKETFEEGEEEATILSAPLTMRKQKQDAQVRRQQKACKFFRHKNALVDKLEVYAPLVREDSADFESPTPILSWMR